MCSSQWCCLIAEGINIEINFRKDKTRNYLKKRRPQWSSNGKDCSKKNARNRDFVLGVN
jgi:hypothetical protein